MRRGYPAFVLIALLLAPTALAGTEADPEVQDTRGRANAQLDLLSAWFEPHGKGVRFTIKVASLPEAPRDHSYFVLFTLEGKRHLAGLGFDGRADLKGHVGAAESQRAFGGIETYRHNIRDASFRPGTPAYLTGVIPYDQVEGLEVGATLIDLAAGTLLYKRESGRWDGPLDLRGSERVYTVTRPPLIPGVPAWAGWVIGAPLLLAAGAVGGFVYAKRARTPTPVAREIPVLTDAPRPAPRAVAQPAFEPPAPEAPRGEPAKPRFALRPPR